MKDKKDLFKAKVKTMCVCPNCGEVVEMEIELDFSIGQSIYAIASCSKCLTLFSGYMESGNS